MSVVVLVPCYRGRFYENVQRSLPLLGSADKIAVASDRFHVRRATEYLRQLRPDLAQRVVAPSRGWWRGWWMDAGGAAYEVLLRARRVGTRRRETRRPGQ